MTFYRNDPFQYGPRLQGGEALDIAIASGIVTCENGIVCNGTSRAAATQLRAVVNYCSTVAASGQAILPKAIPGAQIRVYNYGANTLTLIGFTSSDTIDTAASVTLSAANRGADFDCIDLGKWVSGLVGATTS